MNKGIISMISALGGALAGAAGVSKMMQKSIDKKQSMSDKHLALFLLMNQWVRVKQEGKNLSSYFEKKSYKKIAIYGMSYAGETLIEELRGTGIEISYGIDKNVTKMFLEVEVLSLEDNFSEVDAIVVTAVTFFDEIEEALSKKVDYDIISLEDILYEV